jgi:hypothetical protein
MPSKSMKLDEEAYEVHVEGDIVRAERLVKPDPRDSRRLFVTYEIDFDYNDDYALVTETMDRQGLGPHEVTEKVPSKILHDKGKEVKMKILEEFNKAEDGTEAVKRLYAFVEKTVKKYSEKWVAEDPGSAKK